MINTIVNQINRIINDDGKNDKDFSSQEEKLRIAKKNLEHATDSLIAASEALNEVLISKAKPH